MQQLEATRPARQRLRLAATFVSVLGLALALSGGVAQAASAKVIRIKGIEYQFIGVPKTLKAGTYTFEFTDAGSAPHEMAIAKLKPGVTLDQALAAGRNRSSQFIDMVGGADIWPGTGAVASITLKLTRGTYGVVCTLTGPDGQPHFLKGMKATFTVT